MIYTLGYREVYDTLFAGPNETIKRGRRIQDGLITYPGGTVFPTVEAARQFMSEMGLEGYTVYGVLAEWGQDTIQSNEGPFHDLLRDAKMVRLIERT